MLPKDITAIKLRRIQRLESRKSTDVKQTTSKALYAVHEPKLNEHVERISNIQITFLYTCVHKGKRLKKKKESIFYVCTHFKPTETFLYRLCERRSLKVPLRRKFLLLFSPFSCSNPFNEFEIAKIAIN